MRKKGKESYRKACVVFNGQKEFTKRETIGEKWRYKVYLFFPAREEREWGWKKGQLAKKRRRKGGGGKNDCHEIKKNEWLYLSVIKTVPKNKQTRGNKPRARL